mgnify:CR=1 FL=1
MEQPKQKDTTEIQKTLSTTAECRVYTIIDDILLALRHQEDKRRELSDAELITTVITAAIYFGGTIEKARDCLKTTGLIPNMISKSRFNRRLHDIGDLLFDIFHQLGEGIKPISPTTEYLLDSFPLAICTRSLFAAF